MIEKERQEAIESLTKTIDILSGESSDAEAWPVMTGLPTSALRKLLEWSIVNNVDPQELLIVAASLGYAHAKKIAAEATSHTKAASDLAQ